LVLANGVVIKNGVVIYAFALFLQSLDFTGFAIRGNFQGFQGAKKFLQKRSGYQNVAIAQKRDLRFFQKLLSLI